MQLCGAVMVVSVPVSMHLRRMGRLVPVTMPVLRVSGPMRLRMMGVAVGVLAMRMAVTVNEVVSMSVII